MIYFTHIPQGCCTWTILDCSDAIEDTAIDMGNFTHTKPQQNTT